MNLWHLMHQNTSVLKYNINSFIWYFVIVSFIKQIGCSDRIHRTYYGIAMVFGSRQAWADNLKNKQALIVRNIVRYSAWWAKIADFRYKISNSRWLFH